MDTTKISELPAAGPLLGGEQIPLVQNEVTYKAPIASIAQLAGALAAPGPQGPVGPQGPQGPQGEVGDVNPQMIVLANTATAAAAAAEASEDAAAASALAASGSASTASSASNAAQSSLTDALTIYGSIAAVQQAEADAEASALAAASSASSASTSANTATNQASAALGSANAAAGSASQAQGFANDAFTQYQLSQDYAEDALGYADAAAASAASALNSANSATASADATSVSAGSAIGSANAASASASAASGSAIAAQNSANSASASASSATSSASAAAASASSASISASSAAASIGAAQWVSGFSYASGALAWSVISGRIYRRLSAGSSTTDPANDAVNWVLLSVVVEQTDIGTAPNEIPLNQYLGSMAYEDHDSVAITGGVATLSNATLANATIAAGTATLSSATVTTGVLTTADITTLRQTTEISTVEPTLNLNFARSKTLDPRVTFVRASEGRFWDGKTFAKAEENLLLQSQTFETANWAPTAATVTANTTAAPDGTTTADTLTAQASASIHVLGQGVGGSTLDRVFSVFAKAGTHNFVQFCFAGDGVTFANFDLGSGVVGTKAAAATSSITSLGNGWYRCTIGFVSTTSLSVEVALVASASAVRRESWTAAGTETIFIWGAQLEQRSAVTAYTPTTTAPITRYQPQLMTAPSGTPRFDHNPVTGESLGLLIEESRTNLLLRSQEFENATWDKSINISAASNVGIAPDGTLTADKLIATTTNAFHGAFQLVTKAATATTYTFSAYAKIDDAITTRIRLQPQSGANAAQATFDLAAQSASTALIGSGWVLGATSITPVGNGWLRLAFTFTTDATTNVNPAVYVGTPSSFSYTGDGFSGIYIWGAQLEAGAFPTSYIPTVAAQVTRQADAASMTGTNFSSWYRQDEGTLYVESVNAGGVVGGTFGVSDGTNNNRMFLQSDTRASTFAAYVQAQGTAQSSLTLSAAATLTSNKLAMAYKTNDLAASRQGGAAATDSSAAIPLVNRATFGWAGVDAAATASGWFRKAAYYPARLANAELQEMTA